MLALMQLVFPPIGIQFPLFVVQLMPRFGEPFLVQSGNQPGSFGIIQARPPIINLFGVMHQLGAGLVDRKACLSELVAQGIAIRAPRFHDHRDKGV